MHPWTKASVCENWYGQIWSHYDKSSSSYHEEPVQKYLIPPHKQTLLGNMYMEEKNNSLSLKDK